MWRFGGLLALDINDPEDIPHIFNLGEGHTPLLQYHDHALALETGFSASVPTPRKVLKIAVWR